MREIQDKLRIDCIFKPSNFRFDFSRLQTHFLRTPQVWEEMKGGHTVSLRRVSSHAKIVEYADVLPLNGWSLG